MSMKLDASHSSVLALIKRAKEAGITSIPSCFPVVDGVDVQYRFAKGWRKNEQIFAILLKAVEDKEDA